jgi:L-fuconolactonase
MRFDFTDSHVHFWDTTQRRYPWLNDHPSIASRHGPEELGAEAADGAPSRVVFVQADCDRHQAQDEVEWVETLATTIPKTAGIVAFAPMDKGARTASVLRSLAARPLVRGVRHLIQGETDPAFCLSSAFIEGVRACGSLGLSVDLCVRHHQLGAVTQLVRHCPHTSFILDHAGKPDLVSNKLDAWRSDIAVLARLPNVVCKISGLVTEAGGALELDRFAPVVGHLLDTFGSHRLLFGSDWPVVKLAAPYPTWLTMAKMLLAPLSGTEQSAIFNANAARVYRLG